jgi:hypothetical protein
MEPIQRCSFDNGNSTLHKVNVYEVKSYADKKSLFSGNGVIVLEPTIRNDNEYIFKINSRKIETPFKQQGDSRLLLETYRLKDEFASSLTHPNFKFVGGTAGTADVSETILHRDHNSLYEAIKFHNDFMRFVKKANRGKKPRFVFLNYSDLMRGDKVFSKVFKEQNETGMIYCFDRDVQGSFLEKALIGYKAK